MSVYRLRDQLVRHTVEMVVQFHVIVDVDPQRLPLAEAVGLGRKRLQGGAVELAKQIPAAARALFEGTMIQAIEPFGNRLVQREQIEESLVTERGDDPTLGQ